MSDSKRYIVDPKILQEHLETHWGKDKNCPMCSNPHWIFPDQAFEIREFYNSTINENSRLLPVMPVWCNKCGYTTLINLMAVSLFDEGKLKEEAKNE